MSEKATASVSGLFRYPVKGLSADRLEAAVLQPDAGFPADRRFAIAHGSAPIDPSEPQWLKKAFFLQVMSNPKLAALETVWHDESETLEVRRGGRTVAKAALSDKTGRTVIEQFFAAYLKSEMRGGAPKLVESGQRSFSDVEPNWISIIGLASVEDLGRVVGTEIDPARFRANMLLSGTAPWEEFNWVGRDIAIGDAVLRVEEQIGRCAATNVHPQTGDRDMTLPRELMRGFGHDCCGVYARVVTGGTIRLDDTVSVI